MPYSDDETESEFDPLETHSRTFVVSKIEAQILEDRKKINAFLRKLSEIKGEEKQENLNAPKKR